MKMVFVSVLLALIGFPALAAEFYIVQDIEKQTCTVTQDLPKDDRHAVVGEGAYNDEATAASDMKKMLVCNARDAAGGAAPQPPSGLKIK
jgi:hypothetical protein